MRDGLRPGLSPVEAVAAFTAACNRDATVLFITESWVASFKDRLRTALPPALTDPLVAALRDALYKRRHLAAVVEFIEQQPMTWVQYDLACEDRYREADLERARTGYFSWEEVIASEDNAALQRAHAPSGEKAVPADAAMRTNARACPQCCRPASELDWIYFSSPAWTWKKLCGRAGWLVVCKPCHLQVAFFLQLMN